MKNAGRFFIQSVGVIVALMVAGMLMSIVFRVEPEQLRKTNLINDWQWYRVGFYAMIVVCWPLICKFLTRPRINLKLLDPGELERFNDNRKQDMQYIKSQWWKVILLIIFFELIVIHQMGL